ncbi:hypothetical protein J4467_01305 [Candidatus Woesearchaeota archaeon]|nr:hypothetical protein [Candidatus Woesearchaeota archaeon]
MKKFTLLLLILILIPLVSANFDLMRSHSMSDFEGMDQSALSDEEIVALFKEALITQLPEIKDDFNSDSQIPSPIDYFLNEEKINLILDNDYKFLLIIKEGKIDTLQESEFSDPDFNVYINDPALLANIQGTFNIKESLDNGDITLEGVGFFNKLKLAPLKLALKFL